MESEQSETSVEPTEQADTPTESIEETDASAAAVKQSEQVQVDGTEVTEAAPSSVPSSLPTPTVGMRHFDVLAIEIVAVIAALFAIVGRLNPQPSNSLTPVAVLSATGCGLLITAMRKLRTTERPGLLEAGVGGFVLAAVQFIAALTYPSVLSTLSTDEGQRLGFLTTWGLVAVFSIIFSVAGAALGHLAFAPLRPLPQNVVARGGVRLSGALAGARSNGVTPAAVVVRSNQRSTVNYLITVVLFGLAPTVAGYVFAAAFEYMLSVYQLTPGPYPTLRLLSTVLPWQVPIHLDFSGSNQSSIILLLWRIPLFVGNPTLFDVQALEPLVLNGGALSLLLLTMHGQDARSASQSQAVPLSWLTYLMCELVLGLVLVLPANVWMIGGLQGLLRIPQLDLVVQIRTLRVLDQVTFVLNLLTGPIVCLGIGLLLRQEKRRRGLRHLHL